ncbi:LutC/YkgG family protein [Nocardia sp. NPDC003482]
MSDAKSEVLHRIRSALSVSGTDPVPVPRDYDRHPLQGRGDADRFAAAVERYHARVHRIEEHAIAATVIRLCGAAARVVVPADIPAAWIETLTAVPDSDPLPIAALDGADAVLTGCALAIAATGTLVLDSGAAQGRRALTLVPDHHLCVVFTDQIVDTVPQAFAALDPNRPLTFVSGPSATSDIELDRVEGVHGPRTLDVLLVER